MIRLGFLLILSVTLKPGLSCTCDNKNDTEAYCDTSEFDIPVVGIKIKEVVRRNEVELEEKCLPMSSNSLPWEDNLIKEPTESSSTGPCDKIVLARVFKVIRQGTDVKVKRGRKIYIKTRISASQCGRADDLQKGRRFIMKWPRDPQFRGNIPQTQLTLCDFFRGWKTRSQLKCGKNNNSKDKRGRKRAKKGRLIVKGAKKFSSVAGKFVHNLKKLLSKNGEN